MRISMMTTCSTLAAVGLLGPRLRAKEPAWLMRALPAPGRAHALTLSLLLWMQSIVLVGALGLAFRDPAAGAGSLLRAEAAAVLLAMGADVPRRQTSASELKASSAHADVRPELRRTYGA